VPVYNGDQWCQFQDRRYKAELTGEAVAAGRTVYTLGKLNGKASLMIPGRKPETEIRVDGRDGNGTERKCLGDDYLFLDLSGGRSTKPIRIEISTS
jgi:hypothetical protein